MKKFLLLAAVLVTAMAANAQKFTINVETLAPKANHVLSSNTEAFAATKAAKKNVAKYADADVVTYIETGVDYSDGEYEDEVSMLTTAIVEIEYLNETGKYNGKTLPKVNITGFGSGYCDVYGYVDDATEQIYIPRQLGYTKEGYGDMYLEALYINANNQLAWDNLDVVLTKNENGNYICWEGEEAPGARVGWIITMTGEYEGSIWTYGIESDYLVPNGVEHGWYNFGSGYEEMAYPVYIENNGDEVFIYNFLGMAGLGMLVEEGEVYIPTLQPVLNMPAQAGYPTAQYGEYFRTYAYVVLEGGGLALDEEAEYQMAAFTNDDKTIDMGEDGYMGIWSKFDEEQRGYRVGIFGGLSWTLNEGSFTGINGVAASMKATADSKTFNISGQQVANDFKGIVIRDGKKFIQK